MYSWCSHVWNPIAGRCSHQCGYCYMLRFKLPALMLREKELKTTLGSGKTIFVGSATDMWAHDVPGGWINKVLWRCKQSDNTYFFQSKNPSRFHINEFPENTILGTTLETDMDYEDSKAPRGIERVSAMAHMKGVRRSVTIEPIMDFNLNIFVEMILLCDPEFVSIGADSKGHHLYEPRWDQVQELIEELKRYTEIRVKHNLERLRR